MPRRIDKINKHIQRTFGEMLQTEVDLPAGVLVTVSQVETTRNLRSAMIWLSVFPSERADYMVGTLRDKLYDLQGSLNRKLGIHPLPRISLNVDHGPEHAENVERQIRELR